MPLPDTAIIPPQMEFTPDQLNVGVVIGSSGGTRVYEGTLVPRAMQVAIKELCEVGAVDICKREVAALQKLDHVNIVKVLGYCAVVPPQQHDGRAVERAYVLLELSKEGAITTAGINNGKNTVGQVYPRLLQHLRWCLQVAEGLKYLHDNDVLHLDVKPANILRFGSTVKLCDFGIAKTIDKTGETKAANRHTVAYAAPELLLGQKVSAETDLYSLGALLCELLTGQRPWGAKSGPEVLKLAGEGCVPDLRRCSWPPFCAEAIPLLAKKLMSKRTTDRGSIVDAIAVLRQTILELVAPKIDVAQLLSPVSNLAMGWLRDVDAKQTLLDALLCLVGVEAPKNRPDLVKYVQQLAWPSTVKNRLEDATSMIGGKDDASDDARAIILYTVESPIRCVVNGALSQGSCCAADLAHVSPFTKRLYGAVQRLGRPYRGRGFRALYADAPPLSAAFNDYNVHFAEGNEINLFQFLSFTIEPTSIDHITNIKRPMIFLRCDDLIGFDIDDVSFQALSGAPREREVIVLPPAYFTVKCRPYKMSHIVNVDLIFLAEKSREGSFMPLDRCSTMKLSDNKKYSQMLLHKPQRSEAQFSCDTKKKENHHDVADCAGAMQLQQVEDGHPHRHPHVASVTQHECKHKSDSMRPSEEVLRRIDPPPTLHEARRHIRATESQHSAVRTSTIASNAMDSLHSSPPAAATVPATEAARVIAVGQVTTHTTTTTTTTAAQQVTSPTTTPPPAHPARPIAAAVAHDNDEHMMMVVFTTATGRCYHNESCFYSPVRYLSEADALRNGKRACRRCGGMPFRRPLLQQ
ncbi:protein kinase, putative [Bodo saltans]|uniref:non-specific serine/threonine protein kinase n=1 Tax=Bodo saltans TaxID=75058 RepID=A0A0S4J5S6_BODSA|nr:protein kinase, putative [Bodo saltans]|eukprot:CUG83400.1 protein kinase, putative [Bodo saltans]